MFGSNNGMLSPAQFRAVKLLVYSWLWLRVIFLGGEKIRIFTGWDGGAGEMAMV